MLKILKKPIALVVFCGFIATSLNAGYDEGVKALGKRQWDKAYKELEPFIKKDDPIAILSAIFINMAHGKKIEAENLFKKYLSTIKSQSDKNNAKAQYVLGLLYSSDIDVITRDENESIRLMRLSAKNDYKGAIVIVSNMDADDAKEKGDFEEAFHLYKKAALLGDSSAQGVLGRRYYFGGFSSQSSFDRSGVAIDIETLEKWIVSNERKKGTSEFEDMTRALANAKAKYNEYKVDTVPIDYKEAFKWYKMAADGGDANYQMEIADMYLDGKGVDKNIAEAIKWYKKAADNGSASYQVLLGDKYANGSFGKVDIPKALQFYEKASNNTEKLSFGNPEIKIARIYKNGVGIKKNYAKAAEWYKKSIEAEGKKKDSKSYRNEESFFALGFMYDDGGFGLEKNLEKAVEYYEGASELGSSSAMYNLALLYMGGKGIKKNPKEAVRLLKILAEQGYADAQSNLGAIYARGEGVFQDEVEAYKWRVIALQNGVDGDITKKAKEALEATLTQSQINEGLKMAKEWQDYFDIKSSLANKTLAQIREQYPIYNEISDEELANRMHEKYFSDLSKEDYFRIIGLTKNNDTNSTMPSIEPNKNLNINKYKL